MNEYFQQDLFFKVQTLAGVRTLAALRAWEAFLAPESEVSNAIEIMWDYILGAQIIAESLGVTLSPEDVTPKEPDPKYLVLSLGENCVTYDRIGPLLESVYGEHAAFVFRITQMLFIASFITDVYRQVRLRDTAKERKREVERDREIADEFLSTLTNLIRTTDTTLPVVFSREVHNSILRLADFLQSSKPSIARFEKVYQITDRLTDQLLPHFPFIAERLHRAKNLTVELRQCSVGPKGWKAYEETCINILQFLFVPPFTNVMVQVRTSDGHERRDAIIFNDQRSQFWSSIRSEFDSRQIVCEFKNTARPLDKDSLNQLRIYLSNPAIGRFGLLFHRKEAKTNLKKAQRRAYEQSRILILLLDDDLVRKLLFARAFLGTTESVLATQKRDFEITY